MDNLVKVSYNAKDEQVVSCRELHEWLEIKTPYKQWFDRMLDYDFEENVDYIAVTQKSVTAQGNEFSYVDHIITIEMAKELGMIQRTPKGKEVRRYFIQVEKAYQDIRFRKADKRHQMECMELLHDMLPDELKKEKISYIKANTIVNKAVSNYFGFPKTLKKDSMNPKMLILREKVLDDYLKYIELYETTNGAKEFIYNKYRKPCILT